MTDKPSPRELNLYELDRVSGGSDLGDLLRTVIRILTGGGPVTTKGLR